MRFVSTKSSGILINLAKQGSDRAFSVLMRRFEKDIFGFAYSLLGNVDDSQDVVQDVFIKVQFALPSYEKRDAKFSTWLFVITRNQCLNFLKKNRFSYVELEENMATSSFENETVLKNDLFITLSGVPVLMKEAFVLVALQGFSYDEAAKILKTKPGTVKSRVHKARLALIKKMDIKQKEMSLNEV